MTKFLTYTVGYPQSFMESCNTGWGCGYILIPKDSSLGMHYADEQALYELPDEDGYAPKYYPQDMPHQECTYFESITVGIKHYCVAGFDTAHSHNGPEDDLNFILANLMDIVSAYEQLDEHLQRRDERNQASIED